MNDDDALINPGKLHFNGIDASTGTYVTPPLSPRQVAKLAASVPFDEDELHELQRKWQLKVQSHLGTIAGVDSQKLEEAGWGVVFAPSVSDDVKEALKPLLDLRENQAGKYYHDFSGERAFCINDSKTSFLSKSGVGFGPANPKKVPYYLLLVGNPKDIPFEVQYQLDVQYAVGRIHFETVDEYANYAATVVAAEEGKFLRPKKMTLFGVRNRGDVATQLSADYLVNPLADSLCQNNSDWEIQRLIGPECTRKTFLDMFQGESAPALLFSASHGIGFPNGDFRQLRHQGAILCQDWPGPLKHRGPIPEDFYVAGDHIPKDARLEGLVAFLFACYGGGTPDMDDFAHLVQGAQPQIAPHPFMAALPNSLLGRPNGALAVIGHVDRAWGYSFVWPQAGPQLEVFESAIDSLLNGWRVGSVMEWFNNRYAELSTGLTPMLHNWRAIKGRPESETLFADEELAGTWTAHNDARNYVVIGDPAVKLSVANQGE